MPLHISIIHTDDFLKLSSDGTLDFKEAIRILDDASSVLNSQDYCSIIVDTRKAQSTLSYGDLFHLSIELFKHGMTFSRRTAILCPQERLSDGQFFATLCWNKGLDVSVFISYEEAMDWLSNKTIISSTQKTIALP
jgi:hypothetical protein